ncbi:hypothetical protein [Streptomyces sp. GbtcB7]|uniref:hypothetical protein n=1 Tax=Streptomyces sp. GbtcB7 TaxID=2824752 RepID=UPI0020C5F339|nr:hypothetical protein [Streptomyces sp. GbtcB7]
MTGMPIVWALANPKIGEREVLASMLETDASLVAEREGILLISDKGFAGKVFEQDLAGQGIELLRPSRKREKARYGEPMLKKARQLIESVNDSLKGRLDLEQHGGRTFEGVAIRVAQRILAMTAAIWHNRRTSAPVTRSLIAYGHCSPLASSALRALYAAMVFSKRSGAGRRISRSICSTPSLRKSPRLRERRWLRGRWSTLFASAADAQGDDGDKEPQGTEG